MIKRTIEISSEPANLTVKLDQLLVNHGLEIAASIPCEDIGMLVVDQPRSTYSQLAGSRGIYPQMGKCGSSPSPTSSSSG